MGWTHLDWDREKWRGLVSMAVEFRFHNIRGVFNCLMKCLDLKKDTALRSNVKRWII